MKKVFSDEKGNQLFISKQHIFGRERGGRMMQKNKLQPLIKKFKEKQRKELCLGKEIELGKKVEFGKPLDFGKEIDLGKGLDLGI